MTTFTDLINSLRDLEKRATPTGWHTFRGLECTNYEILNSDGSFSVCILGCMDDSRPDAELIASMRNSLPLLLDIIEVQRKALEFYSREENYRDEYKSHEWVAQRALSECEELCKK